MGWNRSPPECPSRTRFARLVVEAWDEAKKREQRKRASESEFSAYHPVDIRA